LDTNDIYQIVFLGGTVKRVVFLLFVFCVFSGYCFSQTTNYIHIKIEINNVVINGGKVYLLVFSTKERFKNEEPQIVFELNDNSTTIFWEILIPNGEYVITAFQDSNNNRKLDYGLFNKPKELLGMPNYSGKGYPSKSFDKEKIFINNMSEKINIVLYKL
jgi:uncharacterized protein (DUF2141 family)